MIGARPQSNINYKRSLPIASMLSVLMLSLTLHVPANAADISTNETTQQQLDAAAMQLANLSKAFKTVAKQVEPSVVRIVVKARPSTLRSMRGGNQAIPEDLMEEFRRRFNLPDDAFPAPRERGQQPNRQFENFDVPHEIGAGSGWVWDNSGHIITNHHVIENAETIEVRFADGKAYEARLVGSDAKTDIAVLKVARKDLTPSKRSAVKVEQGEIVFAFGSPFRYDFSMSQGIVSGQGRQVGVLGQDGYENFIQTDAAINPGNSGGPLTNVRGQVIGMNTAIASRTGTFSGIGFAIPMEMINEIVGELVDDGRVVRGYLGAWIGDDPKLIRSFGVESGVVLHDMIENGPAEKANLKSGDIVTAIAGKPIDSAAALRRTVAAIDPGTPTVFTIIRDGRERSVTVTIGTLPGSEQAAIKPNKEIKPATLTTLRKLGIDGSETVTSALAKQYRLPTQTGVVITDIRSNSAAAAAGLRTRMIVTHVMGQPIKTAAQLEKALAQHELTEGVRLKVQLDVKRSTFVVLSLETIEPAPTG